MPLFGPVYKKFGERRNRECTPQFRFEGKGYYYKDIRLSKWDANNSSVAYFQLHSETKGIVGLSAWDNGVGNYRHCKCLSNMFINIVNLRITTNSIGKALEFGIYRDQVRLKKLATFTINETGTLFTSLTPISPIPLVFDSDYAWGFQTVDGTNPTYNDGSVTLSCTVSCLVQMGAGDP